ncbi:GSCFA domain-containing protein [Fibrella forsythiae]|uniref:GSCFA domain-containing protein n=1 Tax=Fibrella forsythiae TaxID=2817061 RepID=A0ABS3JRY4_9BACT|nr:GSCFA domain-containing protein [Fibrella forsythiae]MBO0952785.1 GSCFA domain-containing protein [Fibrella forsythiae]
MQFRTELTPDRLPVQLKLTDRIVTIGSCFAEVIGARLADHKLTVLNNPLGTLFNPFSISKLLKLALTGNLPDEVGYVERDGLWFHYDFHSSFWGTSKAALAQLLQVRLQEIGTGLQQADWLLLTLGSAVVYQHKETQQLVANCHKMPGTLFNRFLCQIGLARNELTDLFRLLQQHNPKLTIILTVSPVRHIRDGLPLNSASKALLRTVCAELCGESESALDMPTPMVYYFPAYELVQDDLRDYRFYEADLIHPNAQAHEYVFTKFAESAFTPDLCAFVKQWEQIRRAMAHRPLHGLTDAHRLFLQKLLRQIEVLPASIDTTAERAEILNRLL